MLSNDESSFAFNSFVEVPKIPYKILEVLLSKENNKSIENFWKLLKYTDSDPLSNPNLTYEEKVKLIWNGEPIEQEYRIFLKPLVGSSVDSPNSQTQLRIYRNTIMPETQYNGVICIEVDLITNEKVCLVRDEEGILCERTDLMETLFLDIMNGRDIGVGSGLLSFNRQLTRSCNSQLDIGNSKTFYGRSLILGLNFATVESGDGCG